MQIQVMSFKIKHPDREKYDLYDFNHGMDAGTRWACLRMSKTAGLLGILYTTVSRHYTELCGKNDRIGYF